jgi:hypothetical protein
MKLTRIAKLWPRVFRDFAWLMERHPFAQFNVIYGWNCSGKTKLSWMPEFVENNTALLDGEAALKIEVTTKVAGFVFASAQAPQERIFNQVCIGATLSQTDRISPIYFFGEDSIYKQARAGQLKRELTTTDVASRRAEAEKTKAESMPDDFCKEKAKIIKKLLNTANSQIYNNYDKQNLRLTVEAMDAQQVALDREYYDGLWKLVVIQPIEEQGVL